MTGSGDQDDQSARSLRVEENHFSVIRYSVFVFHKALVHVEHRAASGIGMQIHAQAELESFDGRFYTMRVYAHDVSQEIGRGTVPWCMCQVSFNECAKKHSKPLTGLGFSDRR